MQVTKIEIHDIYTHVYVMYVQIDHSEYAQKVNAIVTRKMLEHRSGERA